MSTNNKAPGPALQRLNELLHQEPFSFLFYGVYWFVVLAVFSPLAGVALLCWTFLKTATYLLMGPCRKLVEAKDRQELAVLITGCDSGFGQDLAFALAKKGYVVFAGCLRKEAMEQFEGESHIHAMLMDVTKNDQVESAVGVLDKWLKESPKKRNLHAVVNNAGIGHGGLVDWLDLEAFQQDMDVNYFGIIRTVKACFPLLKAQCRDYKNARVINVVSMAGLVTGGFAGSYHGSKFAAEAISSCLRHELKAFDVHVVTVNPSFHETPLTISMGQVMQNVWKNLSESKRDEYGQDFFDQFVTNGVDLPAKVMWRRSVVKEQLLRTVELVRPPCQVIVGSDAKYSLLLMRHFPCGCKT